MPLESLAPMLKRARSESFAVGAFDIITLEGAEAVVEVAEEERSPVVLAIAEQHLNVVRLHTITHSLVVMAGRATVPVCLHLDHGVSFPTIMLALRSGFSSVMFDGSALSFEENAARTAKLVEICWPMGVSVEAELGHIGAPGDDVVAEEMLTSVEEAQAFVGRTGVGALAVAIGTVHGLYSSEPRLSFDRLHALREAVDIPLVLHGGTGLSPDDFRRCVEGGITKINFYTGIAVAVCRELRALLADRPDFYDYGTVVECERAAVRRVVREHIRIFGAAGRA